MDHAPAPEGALGLGDVHHDHAAVGQRGDAPEVHQGSHAERRAPCAAGYLEGIADAPAVADSQLRRDRRPARLPERTRLGARSLPPGDPRRREQVEAQNLEKDLVRSGQGDVQAVERPRPRHPLVGEHPGVERLGKRRRPPQHGEVGIPADRVQAPLERPQRVAVDDLDRQDRRDAEGNAQHAQHE